MTRESVAHSTLVFQQAASQGSILSSAQSLVNSTRFFFCLVLVQVGEFVRIEDDEAEVGEAAGACVGLTALEVGLVNL